MLQERFLYERQRDRYHGKFIVTENVIKFVWSKGRLMPTKISNCYFLWQLAKWDSFFVLVDVGDAHMLTLDAYDF